MPEELRGRQSKLTLSTLGQLAEIVASVAVLITLVFLVVEVRQNTETTQATSYDRSMEGLNQWRLTVASDPDLSRLWAAYVTRTSEDQRRIEDFRLNLLVNSLWGVYENAYYSNERGLLGASEWSRFQFQVCVQYRLAQSHDRWAPLTREEGAPIRSLLTEEFASFAESECLDGG